MRTTSVSTGHLYRTVMMAALLFAPLGVHAETFSGKLNGFHCVESGTSCPLDRLDPHVALEPDFVLQVGGGDYYFLTNVPRDVKLRHALQSIEVSGAVNRKYNAIDVDQLKIGDQLVWSDALQKEAFGFYHNR